MQNAAYQRIRIKLATIFNSLEKVTDYATKNIFFALFCTFVRKQKSLKVIDFQGFSLFCFSHSWCHQKENYYCIPIDNQPFILFQFGKSTRFSTRLFFIVLLAICMISVVKVGKSREMRAILRVKISRKDLFALYTRLKYHTLVSYIGQWRC